jgi:hypothetical protein
MAATASFVTAMVRSARSRRGVGPVEVRRAKVRDRGDVGAEAKTGSPRRSCRSGRGGPRASTRCCRFYLRGVSTGDFQEALAALLGKDAPNSAGELFACRHCYGLAYESQQEPMHQRGLGKAQKIRMQMGGSQNMFEPFPDKPKGMHWRTYDRGRGARRVSGLV